MQESINKYVEELKNKHTETNNTITDIKNTLEGYKAPPSPLSFKLLLVVLWRIILFM